MTVETLAMSGVVVLTVIEKAGGHPLSKRIALGEDGRPRSDTSLCWMIRGTARRIIFNGDPAAELAGLIGGLSSAQALVLGTHGADLPDLVRIDVKDRADPEQGTVARTRENFVFRDGEPAFALLDYDQKGMPKAVCRRLEEAGGFEAAVQRLVPGLANAATVLRASTSAGILHQDTGERFAGSGGLHLYVLARDGADIPRFLKALHRRAWLAGFGWIMVGAAGQLLERSIVDVAVGAPERLVFEGAPTLEPPLVQDAEARRPSFRGGAPLDTRAAVPELGPEELAEHERRVKAAKAALKPAATRAQKEWLATEGAKLGPDGAAILKAALTTSTLSGLFVLHFDDDTLGTVAVDTIMAEPERFRDHTLADPLDGVAYGRGKAKLFVNNDGSLVVHSFAHGGRTFRLAHSMASATAALEKAGERADKALIRILADRPPINRTDEGRLIAQAARLAKAGKRDLKRDIDTARRANASERAQERQEIRENGSEESNGLKIVLQGGERAEILAQIEQLLRSTGWAKVGWIFARGQTTVVLRVTVNEEKLRAGAAEITLPPKTAYLVAPKPEHVAALLDREARFFALKKEGEDFVEVACDCPADLARHILANANLLPLLAISRTPFLRDDGSVVERPGYDPRTGIFYAPEIDFPEVPSAPTPVDARRAYERLTRPFRGFPFKTEADLAAVVAEILTLLVRHQVPRAPGFLHNAPEAGSGKTKLFETVSLIAIGTNAVLHNADVLEDKTELRKILTTLTLAATPLAVFDNVKRGAEIRSPGLANYLTATTYGDRLLGSNEKLEAPTCTVLGLTGNGCEIGGDNTRRVLRVDLDARVERPELRAFDFDCETEARRDRAELVVAALILLRAHALAGRPAVPGRPVLGSFEDWDRRVCGALVFAGAPDPLTLLERTRTVDPERGRLAELLHVLVGVGATAFAMKSGAIIREAETALKQRAGHEEGEAEAREWLAVLGRFGEGGTPNARSLGRYLTRNAGRVVDGMTLLVEFDTHTKSNAFRVVTDEARDYAGFGGVSSDPFQSRGPQNCDPDRSQKASHTHGTNGDKPRETPPNPAAEAAVPPWTDWPSWGRRITAATDRTAKLKVVQAWGEAAGGTAEGFALHLPPGLPDGLALRDLKRLADEVGLYVVEGAHA